MPAWRHAALIAIALAPSQAFADARIVVRGCDGLDRATLADLVAIETRDIHDPSAAFELVCEGRRLRVRAWCGLEEALDLRSESPERLVAITAAELGDACLAQPAPIAGPPPEEASLEARLALGAGYRALGSPLAHAVSLGARVELEIVPGFAIGADVFGLFGVASTSEARVDLFGLGGAAHAEAVLVLGRLRGSLGAGFRVLGSLVTGVPERSGESGRSEWGLLAGPSGIVAFDVIANESIFVRAALELLWVIASFRATANDGTVFVDFAGPSLAADLAFGIAF